MHGLAVIGTSSAADEPAVAAALCEAGRGAGADVAAFVASVTGPGARAAVDGLAGVAGTGSGRAYETAAPPLIAARHAGETIEPAALLDEARATAAKGLLVVTTSGGLLAPLAERYDNRDLAQELALPVVFAAAAGPDLLNHALLAIASARVPRLAVAAVVVTGWPDTPGRVLLDERALLESRAGAPVLTLSADAARGWPVAEWAAASPGSGPPLAVDDAAGPTAPRRVVLEPYSAWEPRPVGDPRSTPRAQIMATMLEIVGAEGPMTATRAYALYNRASGGRKLTTVARAPLSSSVYWLAQERKVVLVRKDEIPWQDDDVVRMPDSPAVRVRELGPRSLEEVPLDEIAELVRRLRAAGHASDATGLKRAVLNAYGLVRLTTRADEYLGLALDLADA